jgi:hypothetical protein
MLASNMIRPSAGGSPAAVAEPDKHDATSSRLTVWPLLTTGSGDCFAGARDSRSLM